MRARQRSALVVGYGHQGKVPKSSIEGLQVRPIQPAVQRGDRLTGDISKGWKMEQVHVKVQDVKFVSAATHLIQHHQHMRYGVAHGRIQSQRLGRAGHELSARTRVTAGKDRYLVTLTNQLFSEVRD